VKVPDGAVRPARAAAALFAGCLLLLPAVSRALCPPTQGWERIFAGADGGPDAAQGIAVDSSGNTIVVGYENTAAQGRNWKIIKYAPDGSLVAQADYDGPATTDPNLPMPADDAATAVAVDSGGNIWVVGWETAIDWSAGMGYFNQYDWRIRKYSPDLSSVLADIGYDYQPAPFDGDVNGYWTDYPLAVVVDASDNVIVAGAVSNWGVGSGGDDNLDFMLRKFDSTGAWQWDEWFPSGYGYNDIPYALGQDSSGNLVEAGCVTTDPFTPNRSWYLRRIDTSGGFINDQEMATGGVSYVSSLAVSQTDGKIVAAGVTEIMPGSWQWQIYKFPAALGAADWGATYAGVVGGTEQPGGVAMDAAGNVLVAGLSHETGSFSDWMMRRYLTDGTVAEVFSYDNGANIDEGAAAVACASGTVFVVAGFRDNGSGVAEWRTAKYFLPSCLEVAASNYPPSACVGGSLEVVLTVTNNGTGQADGISATLSVDTGESALTLASGPGAPVDLAPGGSLNFTWVFNAVGGAAVSFTVTALGTDSPSQQPLEFPVTGLSAMAFQNAALSATISVYPATVQLGDTFEVVLSVTNTGGADASGVEATMWVDSGASLIEIVSGPDPTPVTLTPGSSAYFTWTWKAMGNGIATFTATATGEDACGATQVSAGSSGKVTMPGAFIKSSLVAIPSPVCPGNRLDVNFTVTNTGSGNTSAVSATLSIDVGETLLELVSADDVPTVIGPGGMKTFTWTFSVTGAPQVAFTATAMGTDPSIPTDIITFTTAPPVTILMPAFLEGEVAVTPPTTNPGNTFDVVLSVTNTGEMAATQVDATMWFDSGEGLVQLVAGPVVPVTIGPGAWQYFTWTFMASGVGSVSLTATAMGVDSCKGWTMAVSGTGSLVIQGLGSLEASLGVEPQVQVVGSPVDVILTLTNNGSTDVVNVSVTIWTDFGGARVSMFSDPGPGPFAISAMSSQTFTWQFDAVGTGAVRFTASGAGVEQTVGTPVSASAYADLNIVGLAELCANVTVSPLLAVAGQNVDVVATVSNCAPAGYMGARMVAPVAVTPPSCPATPEIGVAPTGTAAVAPLSSPLPTCLTLAPGQVRSFTWRYSTSGDGTVDFTVTFAGEQDMTPTQPLEITATRALIVRTAAVLSASLDLDPSCPSTCTVFYGDTVKVKLTVFNNSSGPADDIHALTQTVTGSARLTLISAPSEHRYILGYSAYSFVWTYRVDGPGSVVLSSQAMGVDFATLAPAISRTATLYIDVPAPPTIDVTATGPPKIVPGQEVLLTVAVRNTSTTDVCQSGLTVSGGLLAEATLVSVDPILPRCYSPGETREFTVKVRISDAAKEGDTVLGLRAVARGEWSNAAIVSTGGSLPVEVVSVSSSDPAALVPSVNPWRAGSGNLSIRFAVTPEQGGYPVSLKVYNIAGELVRTLVREAKPAGVYDVPWDGKNSGGQRVASGIYLLLVETRSAREVRKLAVIK